jgi:hypothetical protein
MDSDKQITFSKPELEILSDILRRDKLAPFNTEDLDYHELKKAAVSHYGLSEEKAEQLLLTLKNDLRLSINSFFDVSEGRQIEILIEQGDWESTLVRSPVFVCGRHDAVMFLLLQDFFQKGWVVADINRAIDMSSLSSDAMAAVCVEYQHKIREALSFLYFSLDFNQKQICVNGQQLIVRIQQVSVYRKEEEE